MTFFYQIFLFRLKGVNFSRTYPKRRHHPFSLGQDMIMIKSLGHGGKEANLNINELEIPSQPQNQHY